MHEAARREMEILDEGALDKEQRMAAVRELAKAGRLREASAQVVALAVAGPQGEEPRQLLRDLQTRTDLVDTGLQQVMRAVHGRDSHSVDGLRQCAGRLEQLRNVQADHVELERVSKALHAEIDGLEQLEKAHRALAGGDVTKLRETLTEFAESRSNFLQEGRLDARLLDLGDAVLREAETALRSGRLRAAEVWSAGFADGLLAETPLAQRVADLREAIVARKEAAEDCARSGQAALKNRQLGVAEQSLADAQAHWVDGPEVQALDHAVRQLRHREAGIAAVEALADARDYPAAERRLEALGPTPEMLRTRIFDLKKSIARSQGLDAGFLLRVDEGGEFLVLRGDSIAIGNVRDDRADLPILANLAGCHARLSRTMSFHGGMQDQIRAERGDLFCGGDRVDQVRLTDGVTVRLGSAVELAYRVPCRRSLTALLTLRGGFQVSGTDKILLMKDRGRDGRIVIGPSRDGHIKVADADGEVEVYAGRDGQIRVRYEGAGEMDGKPFSGEHPVTAGATVSCGGVTLVLQPWSSG